MIAGLIIKLLGQWRWLLPLTAFAAVLMAVGAWGYSREREGRYAGAADAQKLFAAERAEWSRVRSIAEGKLLEQQTAARKETDRRIAALTEAAYAANQEIIQARNDAARAADDVVKLRKRAAAAAAASTASCGITSDSNAPAASASASSSAGMLADVLGRCAESYQRMAALADERGTSGQACERAYDALTAQPN